jgi:hypothetical protein
VLFVLGEHVRADWDELERTGVDVANHVLDPEPPRFRGLLAGASVWSASFRPGANREETFGFALDVVSPGDIAAGRSGDALFDAGRADAAGHYK